MNNYKVSKNKLSLFGNIGNIAKFYNIIGLICFGFIWFRTSDITKGKINKRGN